MESSFALYFTIECVTLIKSILRHHSSVKEWIELYKSIHSRFILLTFINKPAFFGYNWLSIMKHFLLWAKPSIAIKKSRNFKNIWKFDLDLIFDYSIVDRHRDSWTGLDCRDSRTSFTVNYLFCQFFLYFWVHPKIAFVYVWLLDKVVKDLQHQAPRCEAWQFIYLKIL